MKGKYDYWSICLVDFFLLQGSSHSSWMVDLYFISDFEAQTSGSLRKSQPSKRMFFSDSRSIHGRPRSDQLRADEHVRPGSLRLALCGAKSQATLLWIYIYMYTYIYIYIFDIYIYTYTYVYIYNHIYIHVHIIICIWRFMLVVFINC